MQQDTALRDQMFSLVSEWEQSGLTQKAFCKKHRIGFSRFCYWRQQYLLADDTPLFVPVKVEGGQLPPHSAVTMELITASGLRMVFHQPVPAEFIKQLLG